ncbi:hypothetical protein D0C36_18675 [Mucilaginibacter conchicola]|uniref:Uncharacterized protein n=1 Tax=Mucilaginibacter conchicola TaxID=2303333 RepID=A0A372NPW6_9SPHI|nr:hypothetical protein [Mucilaginibacter conchicola]RFZ90971.1 hypothetical protein D0C36_18675 [Mucilaginibacter conchicola]
MSLYKHLLLLLCLLAGQQTFAQTDADIAAIRQEYQKINAQKLTKQHFTYESSGCVEDGQLDFYLDGKNIVKVTESGAIGDGSWVNQYYYSDGKVIFCLESLEGGPAAGPVTKTEYRYYIKDGKALRMMEGAKVVKNDSKVSDILRSANNIYKAYATKKFAEALCN